MSDGEIFQESREQKLKWLADTEKRIPPGTRVKVVDSDLPEYIGATGVVVDYDIGVKGEWPLVGVKFDTPIEADGHLSERDGFYCDGASDDEIVVITD